MARIGRPPEKDPADLFIQLGFLVGDDDYRALAAVAQQRDVPLSAVGREVLDWLTEHGIDPATATSEPGTRTLYVWAHPTAKEALQTVAATYGTPMTWVFRKALRAFLDEHEREAAAA